MKKGVLGITIMTIVFIVLIYRAFIYEIEMSNNLLGLLLGTMLFAGFGSVISIIEKDKE